METIRGKDYFDFGCQNFGKDLVDATNKTDRVKILDAVGTNLFNDQCNKGRTNPIRELAPCMEFIHKIHNVLL